MKRQPKPVPEPPDFLSEGARALWREASRKVKTPMRQALLTEALSAWDRVQQARAAIAREGLTVVTERSGVAHANPLLKVERENRQLFARLCAELGLHFDGSW